MPLEPELSCLPNVVVLGVQHSNTSITVRQLFALGWRTNSADANYAEVVPVRDLNCTLLDCIARKSDMSAVQATMAIVLEELEQPWVIKDPRFVYTLPFWETALMTYRPALVWVQKDLEAVAKSWSSRGEIPPESLDQIWIKARCAFKAWPGMKLALEAEKIGLASSLYDAARTPLPASS